MDIPWKGRWKKGVVVAGDTCEGEVFAHAIFRTMGISRYDVMTPFNVQNFTLSARGKKALLILYPERIASYNGMRCCELAEKIDKLKFTRKLIITGEMEWCFYCDWAVKIDDMEKNGITARAVRVMKPLHQRGERLYVYDDGRIHLLEIPELTFTTSYSDGIPRDVLPDLSEDWFYSLVGGDARTTSFKILITLVMPAVMEEIRINPETYLVIYGTPQTPEIFADVIRSMKNNGQGIIAERTYFVSIDPRGSHVEPIENSLEDRLEISKYRRYFLRRVVQENGPHGIVIADLHTLWHYWKDYPLYYLRVGLEWFNEVKMNGLRVMAFSPYHIEPVWELSEMATKKVVAAIIDGVPVLKGVVPQTPPYAIQVKDGTVSLLRIP